MVIGNNIDYTKREITSWEGGHLTTTKVILNTGEVIYATVNLKAYKYHPEEGDDVIIYTFQNTPTKALTTAFSKVNVTYESTTDTILYDSKTFARYSDGDIELA